MCLNLFVDICEPRVAMHGFVLKDNIIIPMMLACQFSHIVLMLVFWIEFSRAYAMLTL